MLRFLSLFSFLLIVETRRAWFKPILQTVHKPISSILEKIRLRKMEVLKK
jgi:hypothetical protein